MSLNLRTNLQLLAHLDALVTERHVTRAAEKMGIGQPAMSGALARLRVMFKDPILVKTGAGMEPTARALALTKQINEALLLIEGAASSAEEFDPAQATASFKVMASEGLGQLFLAPLMKIFREKAPNMRFGMAPGDMRRLLEILRDGEFDLVLGYARRPPPNLYQLLIYPQRMVCIAAKGHPGVHGKLTLKQFVALPHVVWGMAPVPFPTMEVVIDEALAERGLSRDVVLRVPNVMLSVAVVAATDMLAVVPERIALQAQEKDWLQIFPVPFPTERVDVSMYWHERRHRDPAHLWLRSTFQSIAHELRGAGASAA